MALEVAARHRLGAFELDARFSASGRVTALFGRSGSGKTTLVNIIGGLIQPRSGRVSIDGAVLLDSATRRSVPKHRRRIGYVFQEGRLFPHLTVRQNLLYGRWFAARAGDPARSLGLDGVVDLLGIGGLLQRRPAALSGGEKQRVAIGRALLCRPRLLLMDEPLASLDPGRKQEIMPYLERLRDEALIPIVYVSHALAEVARLATTLVVLERGRVVAAGPTAEIMGRLDVGPLARDREGGSLIRARVQQHDPAFGLTVLSTGAGELQVPRLSLAVGVELRVHVRARDVTLCLDPPRGISALNILSATILEIAAGDATSTEVRLDCGGDPLLARLTRKSVAILGLRPGLRVSAVVKTVSFEPGGPASDTLDF